MDGAFPIVAGRGDEARSGGSGPDSRAPKPEIHKARDMRLPDLHIDRAQIEIEELSILTARSLDVYRLTLAS